MLAEPKLHIGNHAVELVKEWAGTSPEDILTQHHVAMMGLGWICGLGAIMMEKS